MQFEVCVSMFLLYARFRTSYFPKDQGLPTRILATVLVFLFGWWSLSGPFVTVQSLAVNLRGGRRMTVQELLNQLPASP